MLIRISPDVASAEVRLGESILAAHDEALWGCLPATRHLRFARPDTFRTRPKFR